MKRKTLKYFRKLKDRLKLKLDKEYKELFERNEIHRNNRLNESIGLVNDFLPLDIINGGNENNLWKSAYEKLMTEYEKVCEENIKIKSRNESSNFSKPYEESIQFMEVKRNFPIIDIEFINVIIRHVNENQKGYLEDQALLLLGKKIAIYMKEKIIKHEYPYLRGESNYRFGLFIPYMKRSK